MANRKKRPAANPERDRVKEIFRKNIQIAKKLQHEGYRDTLARYDLSEKYCARRVKAVTHLIPEMRKRYAAKFPDMDIAEEFTEIASALNTTYDELDSCFLLCQGAAIWMLDQIVEDKGAVELSMLLSKCDCSANMTEVYDTQYTARLIGRMTCMLLYRYGDCDNNVIPSGYFAKCDENSIFREILALIPENAKNTAAENLRKKYWAWAELYFEVLYPVVRSENLLHKRMKRLEDELKDLKAQNSHRRVRSTAPSLLSPEETIDDRAGYIQREIIQLGNRMNELSTAATDVCDRLHEYRYSSVQIDMMNREDMQEYMTPESIDRMQTFPVEDPYEVCFALLYLLDQDDDCVWSYSFMLAVVSRAVAMLPWNGEVYDEADDGYWYHDDERIPPQPLDPEWYEMKYTGDVDEAGERSAVNLAQLVYQYTGTIMPRNTRRYDEAAKKLRKNGLKPSQAGMLCAVMNVLGEASRQVGYVPETVWKENIQTENAADDEPATVGSLTEANKHLQAELAQLKSQAKNTSYELARENRALKEQIEKLTDAADGMTQELADQREIVFNQQQEMPAEDAVSIKTAFPYRLSRRVVAFGGHDSWLREIKFKVPDVRFMGENISNAEIIRRADVIWIQTNCIGHAAYYGVINLARRYNRKVRYFQYASAAKCAEQIAEEEEKSKE